MGGFGCAQQAAVPVSTLHPVSPEEHRLFGLALDRWEERTTRLQRVTQRLRVAAETVCGGRVGPVLGVALLDRSTVRPPLLPMLDERYGDLPGLIVLSIFEGSRAAGLLQPGDRVVSFAGSEVDALPHLAQASATPVTVGLIRDGEPLSVEVDAPLGCRFPARLVDAGQPNARALGTFIEATSGLLREVENDTLLAMVIGHEIAHNLQPQPNSNPHDREWRRRRRESQADHVGTFIAAMAGYPVAEEPGLFLALERSVHRFSQRKRTHPVGPKRVAAYHKTIEKIQARLEAGLPLVPDE